MFIQLCITAFNSMAAFVSQWQMNGSNRGSNKNSKL